MDTKEHKDILPKIFDEVLSSNPRMASAICMTCSFWRQHARAVIKPYKDRIVWERLIEQLKQRMDAQATALSQVQPADNLIDQLRRSRDGTQEYVETTFLPELRVLAQASNVYAQQALNYLSSGTVESLINLDPDSLTHLDATRAFVAS